MARRRRDLLVADRAYPDGADYVIVPATAVDHAEEIAWLREQRTHGAAMVKLTSDRFGTD